MTGALERLQLFPTMIMFVLLYGTETCPVTKQKAEF